jgi:hypothetical protein
VQTQSHNKAQRYEKKSVFASNPAKKRQKRTERFANVNFYLYLCILKTAVIIDLK